MMYGVIKTKNTVTELYYDKLDKNKSIDPEQFDKFKKDYRANMEKGETVAESLSATPDTSLHFDWSPYLAPDLSKSYPTAASKELLHKSMEIGLNFEKDIEVQKQVSKLYDERRKMLDRKSVV